MRLFAALLIHYTPMKYVLLSFFVFILAYLVLRYASVSFGMMSDAPY